MVFLKFPLLLFFVLASVLGMAQVPFQEANLDHKYNINGTLHISHQLHRIQDSVFVYLGIVPNEGVSVDWNNGYSIRFTAKNDYQTTENGLNIPEKMGEHYLGKNGYQHLFQFSFALAEGYHLLEFGLKHSSWEDELLYDISLDIDMDYGNSGLLLCDGNTGMPILNQYVNGSKPVRVKPLDGDRKILWVFVYNTDFDIAIPPMTVDSDHISRSLTVNKTIRWRTDSLMSFEEEALYFIQSDTSSLEGISFRIQNEPYPKQGTYEELIKPIRYISTKSENDAIGMETNKKKSFETFWITTASSTNLAQNTIKEYYDRVAAANFFFTGYKEGWKTDMGMVYIIYGKPDKVFKHEEYEQWIYNQNVNMPAIRFTFVKIKNVFSTNHYTLVRDRKFDKHWFRAVELWRKGK